MTPAPAVSKPPQHSNLARVQSLGYTLGDHHSFSLGYPDEDAEGGVTEIVFILIGFRDERGREPDFCYRALEGFPHLGAVIPKSLSAALVDLRDEAKHLELLRGLQEALA